MKTTSLIGLTLGPSLVAGALLGGLLVPTGIQTVNFPRTGPCVTCYTADSWDSYTLDRSVQR